MRLIGSESFFQSHETYNEFNNVQLVKLTGNITKKTFKNAIEKLIEKYELLQQGVVLHNNQKYFQRIKNYKSYFFETNYHEIKRKTDETWKQIFNEEIKNGSKLFVQRALDLNKEQDEFKFTCGLMWKVLLIHSENQNDFEVILTIDHTIADGITICVMIGEIMNFIRKITKNESIDESYVKISPNLREVFANKSIIENENFSNKVCGFKYDFKEKEYKELKQEYVFHEFNGEKLIIESKKKNITVNSAVAAAIFLSYAKHFVKEENGKFMRFSAPMSLRKLAKLEPNSIGMLAAFLNMEFEYKKENINQEHFWELAEQIQKNIKFSVEQYFSNLYFDIFRNHYLNFIHAIQRKKQILEISNETLFNRQPNCSFSNRGKVDNFIDFNGFKLRGFFNTTDVTTKGTQWLVHLTTLSNRFFFSFAVVSPIWSTETLKKASTDAIKILESIQNDNN
eukprot:gene8917-866_t